MTNYRRNFICGGSFFFTANLAERRLCLLVDYIDAADNRSRFGEPLDLQMDQTAFPAASRLRPRGGGLRRSLSSARAQICSTHIPRIAWVVTYLKSEGQIGALNR
jgi:hypothetical protein